MPVQAAPLAAAQAPARRRLPLAPHGYGGGGASTAGGESGTSRQRRARASAWVGGPRLTNRRAIPRYAIRPCYSQSACPRYRRHAYPALWLGREVRAPAAEPAGVRPV